MMGNLRLLKFFFLKCSNLCLKCECFFDIYLNFETSVVKESFKEE